jgi:hypothetical protein
MYGHILRPHIQPHIWTTNPMGRDITHTWKQTESEKKTKVMKYGPPSLHSFIHFLWWKRITTVASFAMQWREKLLGHASRKDGLNLMPFGFRQYIPADRRAYYDHFHKVWFLVMCNKFKKRALVMKKFCIDSMSWMRSRWPNLNLWYSSAEHVQVAI